MDQENNSGNNKNTGTSGKNHHRRYNRHHGDKQNTKAAQSSAADTSSAAVSKEKPEPAYEIKKKKTDNPPQEKSNNSAQKQIIINKLNAMKEQNAEKKASAEGKPSAKANKNAVSKDKTAKNENPVKNGKHENEPNAKAFVSRAQSKKPSGPNTKENKKTAAMPLKAQPKKTLTVPENGIVSAGMSGSDDAGMTMDVKPVMYDPPVSDVVYGKDLPFTDFSVAFHPENEVQVCRKATDGMSGETSHGQYVTVIGVKFRLSSKTYFFDPGDTVYRSDSFAIVETSRGPEYGYVSKGNFSVPESATVPPLRKAIRPATKEDKQKFAENLAKEQDAGKVFIAKVADHGLEMKLIDVEYTFDCSKLLFFFTSDGRVDFRELVKDLASYFHCRIELRQMGIRDEAKTLGGLGVCGRPLCCASFLPDFAQVSIKMAKEQSLSLNSDKISGICGRLMCCLQYEYETYAEANRNTPGINSTVMTPDGEGTVVESKPLLGLVKIRLSKNTDAAPSVYGIDDIKLIKRAEGSADTFDDPKDPENVKD